MKLSKRNIISISVLLVAILAVFYIFISRINRQSNIIQDKENNQRRLEAEKDKLTAEKRELMDTIDSLGKDMVQMQAKAENQRKIQADQMQNQVKELQDKIAALQVTLAGVQKENAVLLQDTFKLKGDYQALQNEHEKLSKETNKDSIKQHKLSEKERLQQEKKQKEHELNLAKAQATKEINGLKENIQKLNKQLEEQKTKNAKLQNEFSSIKKLYDQLQAKSKELYFQAKNADNIPSLEKAIDNLTTERKILKEEIEKQNKEIESFNKQKAQMLRDAASAYMQARMFDLAIDYYSRSLRLEPRYADTYYKLGLLYKYSRDNTGKAVYYFKKYLALNPQAKNRKDVEYMIGMLTQPKVK
jgi:chromosome segregation ATPase